MVNKPQKLSQDVYPETGNMVLGKLGWAKHVHHKMQEPTPLETVKTRQEVKAAQSQGNLSLLGPTVRVCQSTSLDA